MKVLLGRKLNSKIRKYINSVFFHTKFINILLLEMNNRIYIYITFIFEHLYS
jgi:hypothetical protein